MRTNRNISLKAKSFRFHPCNKAMEVVLSGTIRNREFVQVMSTVKTGPGTFVSRVCRRIGKNAFGSLDRKTEIQRSDNGSALPDLSSTRKVEAIHVISGRVTLLLLRDPVCLPNILSTPVLKGYTPVVTYQGLASI